MTEADRFYIELTSRNQDFISQETQRKLRQLKILIAGCGSTGGACIEPLARLGVGNFALADNGSYELNNLNRQHAFIEDLGVNKAKHHGELIKRINPYCEVRLFQEGVTLQNVEVLAHWADLIFDAVDVTTTSGIQAKVELHRAAKNHFKPVYAGLDLGFRQWGRSYDYRRREIAVLDGCEDIALQAGHPIQALFRMVPLSAVPDHCLSLVLNLLEGKAENASQLGCTSDQLSSLIVPLVIRFVERGELVKGWSVDLNSIATPWFIRWEQWRTGVSLRRKVKKRLAA